MVYFRGGKRFREIRFSGYAPGIYVPLYVPTGEGFKLVFYDPDDKKVGELGSDSANNIVSNINFELLESGCGSMELTLTEKPSFEIGYRTRVDVFPFFSSDPWYTGFVYDLPRKSSKTTKLRYGGFGYYEQLEWVRVSGSWQNKKVNKIVADIIENQVSPKTSIKYNQAKIAESTVEASSIIIDNASAKEVLSKLSGFEADFVFGVDNYREFFLLPRSNQVVAKLWVGKHCEDFECEEDISHVANRLYVKAGVIAAGSNYVAIVEDGESINKYGVREAVVTAPEVANVDDAVAWGLAKLNETKLKKITGQAKNVFLSNMKPFEAKGAVVLVDTEGVELQMRVVSVTYDVSTDGILADLHLEAYQ